MSRHNIQNLDVMNGDIYNKYDRKPSKRPVVDFLMASAGFCAILGMIIFLALIFSYVAS